MSRTVEAEIAALQSMTTAELAEQYQQLHGRPCGARHRAYLIRKNAWRIQANAEGDLTERARAAAAVRADRRCRGPGPCGVPAPARSARNPQGRHARERLVSVASRLRTLERRAGAEARQRALCALCGGLGRYNALTFTNGVSERDEPPEPCPGCGKLRLMHIHSPSASGSPARRSRWSSWGAGRPRELRTLDLGAGAGAGAAGPRAGLVPPLRRGGRGGARVPARGRAAATRARAVPRLREVRGHDVRDRGSR